MCPGIRSRETPEIPLFHLVTYVFGNMGAFLVVEAVAPALGLALLLCVLGVVAVGVYPKPLVMATRRVASALF